MALTRTLSHPTILLRCQHRGLNTAINTFSIATAILSVLQVQLERKAITSCQSHVMSHVMWYMYMYINGRRLAPGARASTKGTREKTGGTKKTCRKILQERQDERHTRMRIQEPAEAAKRKRSGAESAGSSGRSRVRGASLCKTEGGEVGGGRSKGRAQVY